MHQLASFFKILPGEHMPCVNFHSAKQKIIKKSWSPTLILHMLMYIRVKYFDVVIIVQSHIYLTNVCLCSYMFILFITFSCVILFDKSDTSQYVFFQNIVVCRLKIMHTIKYYGLIYTQIQFHYLIGPTSSTPQCFHLPNY